MHCEYPACSLPYRLCVFASNAFAITVVSVHKNNWITQFIYYVTVVTSFILQMM